MAATQHGELRESSAVVIFVRLSHKYKSNTAPYKYGSYSQMQYEIKDKYLHINTNDRNVYIYLETKPGYISNAVVQQLPAQINIDLSVDGRLYVFHVPHATAMEAANTIVKANEMIAALIKYTTNQRQQVLV